MAGSVIGSLVIRLGLDASGVKSGMMGVEQSLSRHANLAAAGAGAAIGAFVAGSAEDFMRFDDRMREIFSIMPGIGRDAMDKMRSDVRGIATSMGLDVEEVASGVYDAISSGIDPTQVTEFIKVASKAAVAGVSDAKSASAVLAATLNSYSLDASHAQEVADTFFQTVKVGVTTFPELAANMAQISPVASVMGVELKDTSAALAAMTLQGFDTAKAATDIAAVFTLLQKGTPELTKVLQAAGYASGQAALDALGFQGTLEMLRAGADKLGIAIPRMTGRVEAAQTIFALTGDKAEKARDVLDSFGDTAGSVDDAFKVMSGGIGGEVRRIQSFMRDLSISVGQAIEPIAPLFLAFGPQIGRLIGAGLGGAVGLASKGFAGMWTKVAATAPVKAAITAAGAAAGVLYTGAEALASSVTGGLAKVWAGLMARPAVVTAITVAGTAAGGIYAAAVAAGVASAPAAIWNAAGIPDALDEASGLAGGMFSRNVFSNIGKDAGEAVGDGMKEGLAAAGSSGDLADGVKAGLRSFGSEIPGFITSTMQSGVVDPIVMGFQQARRAVAQGFGSVRDAVANPPKIISRDQRLENMGKRMRAVMRNLRAAIKADDPYNVPYWTSAAVKLRGQMDRVSGGTKRTRGSVRKHLRDMGLDAKGNWTGIKNTTSRKARDAADAAISEAQRMDSTIGAIDTYGTGVGLIGDMTAGMRSQFPALQGAAAEAGTILADNLEGGSPTRKGPLSTIDRWGAPLIDAWLGGIRGRMGRVAAAGDAIGGAFTPTMGRRGRLAFAGGGGGLGEGGVHIHVHGNVYGGDAGLRQLSREVRQAERAASRDRWHADQP